MEKSQSSNKNSALDARRTRNGIKNFDKEIDLLVDKIIDKDPKITI